MREIYKPEFVSFVEKGIPIEELERRMKPNSYSTGGFLGESERLLDVIASDDKAVKKLGVTHEQIADRLEDLIKRYLQLLPGQYASLALARPQPNEFATFDEFLKAMSEAARSNFDKVRLVRKEGIIIDDTHRMNGEFTAGWQECPWEGYVRDSEGNVYMGVRHPHADSEFTLENLRLKTALHFPGLIIHLIRQHHFYEGKQSPYRVDPATACHVLGFPYDDPARFTDASL